MNALNPYEYGMPRDAANFQALSPLGFLERAASVCPEHLALINGDQRQTWGQTYRRCTQLAAALSQRGIGVGDTVALLATLEGPLEVRHPDYVAIGSQGEVYANAADWVREHLTFDPAGSA